MPLRVKSVAIGCDTVNRPVYPQNIHRTLWINCLRTRPRWHSRPVRRKRDQTACKPGSVPPGAEAADLGDHSSGPPLAGRFSRPTRTAQAYDSPTLIAEGARSLFGLAPGGACHAVPVARHAVGSYPTLSPFPLRREEVCFLWRYPWGRPRRALPAAMSSWSPDFPRACARDRPAV